MIPSLPHTPNQSLNDTEAFDQRAQAELIRTFARNHPEEIKATRERYAKRADELVRRAKKSGQTELETHIKQTQHWESEIRRYLTSPEGRTRLPGLLPPYEDQLAGRWRLVPDMRVELTSCFLESLDVVKPMPFLDFEAEFLPPGSAGTASAQAAGNIGNIRVSSFRYGTTAAEAENVQGHMSIRHSTTLQTNNYTQPGFQLGKRDSLILEPLAHAFFDGSTLGPNTLDFDVGGDGNGDGGFGQVQPTIHLRCAFTAALHEITPNGDQILLDGLESVIHDDVVQYSAFGLELPFGFNSELANVSLRADLRPSKTWQLTVGLTIDTDARGGPVSLQFDELLSRFQVLPPILSKENCTTRSVSLWDVNALERAMRPVFDWSP